MAQKITDHYLKGKLLLAMPSMGDPRFHRAVIFICEHDENGAMGLVVNHALSGIEFTELVKQLKIESDIMVNFDALDLPVMCGGPVETARGFLLHSGDFIRPDTMPVNQGYGVTGTIDALREVANGNRPKGLLFILGYAGWDAGQLESEIQQNIWLVTEPDPELIFTGEPDEKWTKAVRQMGIDPGRLSAEAGNA